MALRICIVIVLALSVVFMPFWVSLLLAFVGMISFPFFIEAVILFLVSDLLFGVQESRYWGILFVSMLISVAMLIAIEIFKTKSIFYRARLNK